MMDLNALNKKLANNIDFNEDELMGVLKEISYLRQCMGYIASVQAATLESLPKSTSKSEKNRHLEITKTLAAMLIGDASDDRYPTKIEDARKRCLDAIESCVR